MSDWFDAWNPYYFPGAAFYPLQRKESELPPEFRRENRDLRIPLKEGPPQSENFRWRFLQ